jgi:hypothetical protein
MKTKYFLIIFSLLALFLSGCTSINGGCGKQYGCCITAVQKYPCKMIVNRCEAACQACNFNDPACTMCWDCINYSGCSGTCANCR